MTLQVEKLTVLDAPDLIVGVLHAEPDSPSAQRLALLARLAQSPGSAGAEPRVDDGMLRTPPPRP